MANEPAMRWTPAQWAGISTTGRSLLVSAAAGSGKTAVLAARCAHLVCDAPAPCDVDQLLVVTFTDAAATEMRARIELALRQRLADSQDPRLMRQLALVERAQVSTLHGFCARVLRQHFHLVELDPDFVILDSDEAKLLRNDVVRQLFLDRYENDADEEFQRFVDAYGDGNDEPLMRRVIAAHELLCSLVEPGRWLSRAKTRITEAGAVPLQQTELGRELVDLINQKLASLQTRCDDAMAAVRAIHGFDAYAAQLADLRQIIDFWIRHFGDGDFTALADAVRGIDLPRKPSVRSGTPGKLEAEAALDSVRDAIRNAGKGSLRELAMFTEQEWADGLRQIAPATDVFLDLVTEFARRYMLAKRAARGIDFSDLETLALRVLRDPAKNDLAPSSAALAYQAQFEHVLVDEYQDINEVQDAILYLVSRESGPAWRRAGNLFCVGDVKQSIYRFRLAEPQRFLDRYERFRNPAPEGADDAPGQIIDLQANFRSRAPLLNALNAMFVRLMTADATGIAYDDSHHLRPGLDYPAGDGSRAFAGAPIELCLMGDGSPGAEGAEADAVEPAGGSELDRTEREAAFVAARIRQMLGKNGDGMQVMDRDGDGNLAPRPIRCRDIVILLRTMQFKSDQFAEALRKCGIPSHRDSGSGYFGSVEVRDLLALLEVLDNTRQDIPLAVFLRSPLANLPESETAMARIRLAYRDQSPPVPFHEAVPRYAAERDDALAMELKRLLERLRHWRELARHRPVAQLIWTILQETGYLAFCGGLENGDQRQANLLFLHERAKQFGSFARQGLFRFLRFLETLQTEVDFGQPSVLSEADDVVRIMSIHRSKGLEFPVVFLPDLGKRINVQDCSGPILLDRHECLGLSVVDERRRVRYPSLASALVQNRLRQQTLAEELRVLYVAMTRAKEHLVLLGTCDARDIERWKTQYANPAHPLPADIALSAGRMLDWIVPVAGALPREFTVIHAPSVPADAASQAGAPAADPSPDQLRMMALQPLDPPPAPNALTADIASRLASSYPFERFTQLPAARAATEWAKPAPSSAKPATADSPGLFAAPAFEHHLLPTPQCMLAERRLSAADAGSATHLVLAHLDFSRPCRGSDLADQVQWLVHRNILSSNQAKAVDLASIEWLAGSALGRKIRAAAHALRRELAFSLAIPAAETGDFPSSAASPATADPMDQIMLRGKIDLLIPDPAGYILADYKTDHVNAQTLRDRAKAYHAQVRIYRRAVEQITGHRVQAVFLIFLAAKVAMEVD